MNLSLLYVYAATEATSLSEIPARVSPFLKACPLINFLLQMPKHQERVCHSHQIREQLI